MDQLGATDGGWNSSNAAASQAIDDDALAAEQLQLLAERGCRAWDARPPTKLWPGEPTSTSTTVRGKIYLQVGNHPALGAACSDSFHVLSRGTSLDAIAEIPAEKLFFLQLADAPPLAMDVLQWSRHYRCFPGQGGFDLGDFTARVLAAGYSGPLSLEVFNDVFRQADPERMATDAMRSLLALEDSMHQRAGSRRLPAAPPLLGYAFVELAVDPTSVGGTQQLLHGLGFSQAAQHRSKPVTLWQQDRACVLLNAGAAARSPGIAAIAMQSADPRRSAERAESLLAPVLSRDRGPGEADLSAIAAPDGTSVFFCARDGVPGADGWRADFDALMETVGGAAAAIRAIDHIALAQPFDYFDEAALFYRSVLGLQPMDSLEFAGPDGLVRRPGRRVRRSPRADCTERPAARTRTRAACWPAAHRLRLR